jgi:hypothetical protein
MLSIPHPTVRHCPRCLNLFADTVDAPRFGPWLTLRVRGWRAQPIRIEPIDTNGAANILQLPFAHVLRVERNVADCIFVDAPRDADASWLRKGLQAGSYVDGHAKEIPPVEDHVALMHRHPHLEAPIDGEIGVALPKRRLDLNGGMQCPYGTWEFGKHPVSHELEDATALSFDEWLDKLAVQGSQASQHADFVRPDLSAEADHIRRQDRGQPSVNEGLIWEGGRVSR